MKEIQLTQGKFALVDDGDFEFLNQWKWYVHPCLHTWYAYRNNEANWKKRKTIMHRIIFEHIPIGYQIDHINGNGLDNRRSNLRLCTCAQNQWNQSMRTDNTSGYRGVFWHKSSKCWTSSIRVHGKQIYLGLFKDKESAAVVYNEAALKYFGEFARVNEVSNG